MELDHVDYRELFETAPVGLAVLDRNLRYVACNAALADINGIPAAGHIGKCLADIVPEIAGEAERPFRTVLETGRAITDLKFTGAVPADAQSGRSWLENVHPLRDESGEIVAILVSVQEITALEETQKALRTSERMLEASQRLNPDGFAILRAIRENGGEVVDFQWEYANPAAQRLANVPSLIGQRLKALALAASPLDAVFAQYVDTLDSQDFSELEFPFESRRFRGWFRTTVVAIDSQRIAISYTDITKRKLREEELGLALQEYRHRVKNLLAVVGSLVRQATRTARDKHELADTIERQLRALGSAQDIAGQRVGSSVTLEEVVASALTGFGIHEIHVHPGSEVLIEAEIVLKLVLVLHELATNAAKYGALSKDGGRVKIRWSQDGPLISLTWTETGGPQVIAPTRKGFGSTLFSVLKRRLDDGNVNVEFAAEGLKA